MTEMFKDGLL